MQSINTFIALGSNQNDPVSQVLTAITECNHLPGTKLCLQSSLYRTVPIGGPPQAEFVNAVIQLETELNAFELLRELQKIEQQHQRQRIEYWGPRTLDLDILLYGREKIASSDLLIPHPRMELRAFVLVPLLEIATKELLPQYAHYQACLAQLGDISHLLRVI